MPEIRDPIYGDIFLSNTELEILNSKEFQRLRWLFQLPLSHFVFPGATHNRFCHSIGVMELATRIAKSIKEDIPQKDIDCLRIAALLHDVDEPPFYPIFKENYPMKHYAPRRRRVVIEKICQQVSSKIDCDTILSILEGEEEYRFLNQIIDSEVGANRIDYLLRDSFYCGVTYGNIDLRILREFEIKDNELILKKEAIPLVDIIFNCLYQMKVNVYDHRVGRSVLCIIYNLLKKALKRGYKLEDFINLTDEDFLRKLAHIDKGAIRRIYQRNLLKAAYCVDAYMLKDLKGLQFLESYRMQKEEMEKEISQVTGTKVYLDFITLRPTPATFIKVKMNEDYVSLREVPMLKKWYSEKPYEQWKMYVFCEQKDRDVVKNACDQIFGFLEVGRKKEPGLKLQILHDFYENIQYLGERDLMTKTKEKILSLSSNEYATLKKLVELESASASEIARELGKSRSTESIILNNLCNAGLVTKQKIKKRMIFKPNTMVLLALKDLGL